MSDSEAREPEIPVGGAPTKSGSVARVLLLSALISTVLLGLGYQLGVGETTFNRPGELLLLFVDVAPVLWFGAAAIVLSLFRWQSIDQRFRWVMLAALVAVGISMIVGITLFGRGLLEAILEPFTVGFLAAVAGAIAFTSTRVRRLARGTDAGITIVGIGLGFAVVGVGLGAGALRVAVAGPPLPPGAVARVIDADPTTALLSAATLVMIGGLLWLTDRTRNA